MTDNNISNNVRFWSTRVYEGKKKTTYTVRWTVDNEEFSDVFDTAALAEAELSKLRVAASRGVAFNKATGRPVTEEPSPTPWYDFAVRYIDARWTGRGSSAHSRKDRADAFVAITLHLLTEPLPAHIKPVDARVALREWAFNKERRVHAPAHLAEILAWIQQHSKPVSTWTDPEQLDELLQVLDSKLNGSGAAPATATRKRTIASNALSYAVRWKLLGHNPLDGVKKPLTYKTAMALDKRRLPSEELMDRVLEHIKRQARGGPRKHAFFATIRYAPIRPEEAAAVEVGHDLHLPDKGWGELVVHDPTPEVAKQWTDGGERRDQRDGLKGRPRGESRAVPVPPVLAAILRAHIEREGLKDGDLLFQGEKGGALSGVVCRRSLDKARAAVFTPTQYRSPMLKRVYDFRHFCITILLNAGADVALVALWAGNSIEVIQNTYWNVIDGRHEEVLGMVERHLNRRDDGRSDQRKAKTKTGKKKVAKKRKTRGEDGLGLSRS